MLNDMVARKRAEVETIRCGRAALWVKAEAMKPVHGMAGLRGGAVIAELKRRSPSGGELRPDLDVSATARLYVTAGAAAISILTDSAFGGSPADLEAVRAAVDVPVLRKDFIVDPVQIAESRVLGADWVLLIVAILPGDALEACLAAATRAGLHAIVEVHDASEIARALRVGAGCVGINNRDLRTLRTNLDTFASLRQLLPDGVICIAESGVRDVGDARRLLDEGADALLVGETLLRSDDPGAACATLVAAVGTTA